MESITEMSVDVMAEEQWQIAHDIAKTLVQEQQRLEPGKEGISAELGKVIAYLRMIVQQDSTTAGTHFFKYLKILVSNGSSIGHSGKTPDYYRSISESCKHLREYQTESTTLLQILGWAMRLMRYYKEGGGGSDSDLNPISSGGSNRPKPKPNNAGGSDRRELKRPDSSSNQGGKTAMELALERAQKKKKSK